MVRMYALDKKLICGSPEIRIGDKVFPVDDRQKTVRKAMELFEDKASENESQGKSFEKMDKIFELAFGENHKEIENMELSFAASNELMKIVIAAITGEDIKEDKKKDEKSDNFRESDGEVV